MSKLTRKHTLQIGMALRNAERAMRYIMRDDVAVCRRGTIASTTQHYVRTDGATMYEVQRDCGSDLVGLQVCIEDLRKLLESQPVYTGQQINISQQLAA